MNFFNFSTESFEFKMLQICWYGHSAKTHFIGHRNKQMWSITHLLSLALEVKLL